MKEGFSMRFVSSTFAVALLAAMISLAPPASTPAKADGGVLVGTAIYLGADFLVGRECNLHAWPFNILTKTAGFLRGEDYCYRGGYYGAYPAGYGYGYYGHRYYRPYYGHRYYRHGYYGHRRYYGHRHGYHRRHYAHRHYRHH
jgi:hypothetical protein